MKVFRRAIILSVIISTISSCNNNTTQIDPYQYMPLKVGHSITYNVHEENYYSGSANPLIKDYQEKDQITNQIDYNKFLLTRYRRSDANSSWREEKEIILELFPDKLLTTIDNKTYLQMIYPINSSVRWNGNTYNNLDKKQYQYTNFQNHVKVDSLTFNTTLTVIEDNNFDFSTPDILSLHKTIRQYALGTGVIYEQENNLEYCQEDDCIGEEIVEYGTRKTRTIASYTN
jgi:hypothetical protein